MAYNVIIKREGGENANILYKKFLKKTKGLRIAQTLKKKRYQLPTKSKTIRKQEKLEKLIRQKKFLKLARDGKINTSWMQI